MKKIFISYARKDALEFAEYLHDRLNNLDGIDCFLDEKSIGWGESIPSALNKGLSEADHVLIILTPAYVERDWTNTEIAGLQMDDSMNYSGKLLPLLYRECKLPITFNHFRYLDVTTKEKFETEYPIIYEKLTSTSIDADLDNLTIPHQIWSERNFKALLPLTSYSVFVLVVSMLSGLLMLVFGDVPGKDDYGYYVGLSFPLFTLLYFLLVMKQRKPKLLVLMTVLTCIVCLLAVVISLLIIQTVDLSPKVSFPLIGLLVGFFFEVGHRISRWRLRARSQHWVVSSLNLLAWTIAVFVFLSKFQHKTIPEDYFLAGFLVGLSFASFSGVILLRPYYENFISK